MANIFSNEGLNALADGYALALKSARTAETEAYEANILEMLETQFPALYKEFAGEGQRSGVKAVFKGREQTKSPADLLKWAERIDQGQHPKKLEADGLTKGAALNSLSTDQQDALKFFSEYIKLNHKKGYLEERVAGIQAQQARSASDEKPNLYEAPVPLVVTAQKALAQGNRQGSWQPSSKERQAVVSYLSSQGYTEEQLSENPAQHLKVLELGYLPSLGATDSTPADENPQLANILQGFLNLEISSRAYEQPVRQPEPEQYTTPDGTEVKYASTTSATHDDIYVTTDRFGRPLDSTSTEEEEKAPPLPLKEKERRAALEELEEAPPPYPTEEKPKHLLNNTTSERAGHQQEQGQDQGGRGRK